MRTAFLISILLALNSFAPASDILDAPMLVCHRPPCCPNGRCPKLPAQRPIPTFPEVRHPRPDRFAGFPVLRIVTFPARAVRGAVMQF